jgi:hypothetical protein
MIEKIKEYFRWEKEDSGKPYYDFSEVKEWMKKRRENRFQNLCLDIYYWFYRNFEWIWKPYIIKGYLRRFWQRRTKGWDESDVWSLDYTISKFALPRLKLLKEKTHGYPCELNNMEEWYAILDKIIFSMDYIANEREWKYYPSEENGIEEGDYSKLKEVEAKVQEGLDLFGKYYRNLWD